MVPLVPHISLGCTKAVPVHLSNPDPVALLGSCVTRVLVCLTAHNAAAYSTVQHRSAHIWNQSMVMIPAWIAASSSWILSADHTGNQSTTKKWLTTTGCKLPGCHLHEPTHDH